MKKRYLFTAADVQQWLNDLYASSQQVIDDELDYILHDFIAWLIERFGLDEAQQEYLDTIDDSLLDHWAELVCFAVLHRLPITLEKPAETPAVRSTKLVLTRSQTSNTAPTVARGPGKLYEGNVSGDLTFTIVYA